MSEDVPREPRPAEGPEAFAPPYPPGWLDRLIDWVKGLPGPEWAYYLGLVVVQLAYADLVLWLNHRVAWGSIDATRPFFVYAVPYLLWGRSALDRIAGRAFETLRPALRLEDLELASLRYRLTTAPARDTWLLTAFGIGFALWSFTRLPPSLVEHWAPSLGVALLEMGPLMVLSVVVVVLSIYHAIHQLRMVARIHERVCQVDLFRARPLYAFSGLTASTGIGLLLLAYGFVAIRPDVSLGTQIGRILLVAIVPTAAACFLLPLRGMHLRIAAERDRLLGEANDRLAIVIERLHRRVDDDAIDDAEQIHRQLASLVLERDHLAKLSTWPWDPTALTAFLTTLVVPVLLWLLPRLLERLGF